MWYLVALIPVFVLCSCKKDEPASQPSGTDPCGMVSGIHHTDVMGALLYPYDSTDWRAFDEWCPEVEALFADLAPVTYSASVPDSLLIACFPNPSASLFRFGFYRDDSARVDLRITNADHQLLCSFDSLMVNAFILDLDSVGIPSGQLARVYYRVTHPDGTAHRGHGDVQLGM
ncbi:MAG: hypothetical protein ABI432_09640 [Flavobacteriales bacterium]